MEPQKQFILFGGQGFIGKHLQRYLATCYPGAEIHICDIRITEQDHQHHCVDVRKPITLPFPVQPTAVVYNLAAVHTTPGHLDLEYFETNMLGAENICTWARESQISTIVFTSSIAPYGASESLKTEDTLPTPNTPYGISKLVAEKIHQIWLAESPTRNLTIVRPGIVFGFGEGGNFTRLNKALAKGLFAYAGRRDTRKAAIYVKDLVRVMDLASQTQTNSVKLYNCCYPEPPTIEEIVNAMKSVCGIRKRVPTIPAGILRKAATVLGALDSVGLGIHPDRVRKLMVSTNISGKKLAQDYPLQYSMEQAIQDWKQDSKSDQRLK